MSEEVVRLNIRVPGHVREWYKTEADKYSVPYTNYISMLLIQRYETEKEKELLKDFTNVLKDIKDATDSVDAEELFQQLKEIIERSVKE